MDIIVLVVALVWYFSGNKPLAIVAFLALITSYFGYGTNESSFLFKHNISDVGILFSLIIFWYEAQKGSWEVDPKLKTAILVFFLFLLISATIDFFSNNTSFIDIIKTGKSWLALLTFFSFSRLTVPEISKVIKLVVLITIVQTGLYYVQYFSGIKLFVQYESVYEGVARGGFPPTFALLVFLLLLTKIPVIGFLHRYRLIIAGLVFGTVVLSLTRSVLMAFGLGGFLLFFMERISLKNLLTLSLFVLSIFILVSQIEVLRNRIDAGLDDVVFAFAGNYKQEEYNENFSFRIFHFQERLDYILKSPQKSMFGLGFVHETSFKKGAFNLGLPSGDMKGVVQLDSGDFAWSVLILRLGFVGLFVLLILFFLLLRYFFAFRENIIAKVAFIYLLLNLIILSLTSSNIANGLFWPLIFVLFYFQFRFTQIQNIEDAKRAFNNNCNPVL